MAAPADKVSEDTANWKKILLSAIDKLRLELLFEVDGVLILKANCVGHSCRTLMDLEERARSFFERYANQNNVSFNSYSRVFGLEMASTGSNFAPVVNPVTYGDWLRRKAITFLRVPQLERTTVKIYLGTEPTNQDLCIGLNEARLFAAQEMNKLIQDAGGNTRDVYSEVIDMDHSSATPQEHNDLVRVLMAGLIKEVGVDTSDIRAKPTKHSIMLGGLPRFIMSRKKRLPERVQGRTWERKTLEDLRSLPAYPDLEIEMQAIKISQRTKIPIEEARMKVIKATKDLQSANHHHPGQWQSVAKSTPDSMTQDDDGLTQPPVDIAETQSGVAATFGRISGDMSMDEPGVLGNMSMDEKELFPGTSTTGAQHPTRFHNQDDQDDDHQPDGDMDWNLWLNPEAYEVTKDDSNGP